jgi:hypothetical protein
MNKVALDSFSPITSVFHHQHHSTNASYSIFHSSATDAIIILKVHSIVKQNTSLSKRMLKSFVKPFQCRIIHVTDRHNACLSHFVPYIQHIHTYTIKVRHRTWSRARSVQFTTSLSIFSTPFGLIKDLFPGTFSTKILCELIYPIKTKYPAHGNLLALKAACLSILATNLLDLTKSFCVYLFGTNPVGTAYIQISCDCKTLSLRWVNSFFLTVQKYMLVTGTLCQPSHSDRSIAMPLCR